MKKILIMHQSQSYAGTDVFALNIIDGFKKNGYEVEIILNDDNKDINNFHNACKTHNYGHRLLTAYHLDSKKTFVKILRFCRLSRQQVFSSQRKTKEGTTKGAKEIFPCNPFISEPHSVGTWEERGENLRCK